MKKIVTICLSFALLACTVFSINASAEKISISWIVNYGDNFTYYQDTETPDTLYIEGAGKTFDFTSDFDLTEEYFNGLKTLKFVNAKTIKLGDGITYLGINIFAYNDRLEDIYIPDSVTKINPQAFAKNTNVIFHCGLNTAAQKYAVDNGFAYKIEGRNEPGDVNCDNVVNTKDVLLLRKSLAGWHVGIELNSADMNGDGVCNTKDLLKMRYHLANIEK